MDRIIIYQGVEKHLPISINLNKTYPGNQLKYK